jgi:hypothetical protein
MSCAEIALQQARKHQKLDRVEEQAMKNALDKHVLQSRWEGDMIIILAQIVLR